LSTRTGIGALLMLALAVLGAYLGALPWPGHTTAPPPPTFADIGGRLATARPFSAEPALQLAPRFSADGRFVAFALGDERESRIVVQAVDGSSRQFLGRPGALRLSPVFFPDGRRIAYWKSSAGSCAIVEYDLRTGAESPIVDCSMLPRVRFDISPDGRRVAFTGGADAEQPGALWIADVAGGAPRALTTPGVGMGDDLHPRFSPDGRYVAFFRGRDARRQAWVVPSNGGGARALATRQGSAHGLAWLRAGGPLIVAADWDGGAQLHLLDIASGATRALGPAGARFPDVSRFGDVVYESDLRANAAPRNGLAEAAHLPGAGTSPLPVELMMARAKR
jgi:dipeptidyl aminopeptidase/acylaminoacyl peptidase